MESLIFFSIALIGVFAAALQSDDKPDYILKLSKAEYLDDSAVGYAAIKSDDFKAFERALNAGASIRDDLDRLVKEASPAGRIYAAILISRLDKDAGTGLFESLKSDQARVVYRSGSLVEERTVGELAADLLRGEPIIIFRPSE
jgi:hypothetical protein